MRFFALLLLTGCGFDDHRAGELCPEAGPCGDGMACLRGLCQPANTPPDAVGQPPIDATPRIDSEILVDARVPERDLDPPPPLDSAPPPPPVDAAAPSEPDIILPLPVDAAPPPPPVPDAAPPTVIPPLDGPVQGLAGCAPTAWCVYAEADATLNEAVPDTNLNGLQLLEVAANRGANRLIVLRFPLGALANRSAIRLDLVIDAVVTSPGRGPDGADLELERIEDDWEEDEVTWNEAPREQQESLDLPEGPPAERRLIRWDITALLSPDTLARLPDVLSLQLEEGGVGEYQFMSRELAIASGMGHPPRLELRLP